jgi:hypothetical protein
LTGITFSLFCRTLCIFQLISQLFGLFETNWFFFEVISYFSILFLACSNVSETFFFLFRSIDNFFELISSFFELISFSSFFELIYFSSFFELISFSLFFRTNFLFFLTQLLYSQISRKPDCLSHPEAASIPYAALTGNTMRPKPPGIDFTEALFRPKTFRKYFHH